MVELSKEREALVERYYAGRKDGFNEGKAVGSAEAWLDMLGKFTPKQRQHLAMLMAHEWQITEITITSGKGHSETLKSS